MGTEFHRAMRHGKAKLRRAVPFATVLGLMLGAMTIGGSQSALGATPPSGLTRVAWQRAVARPPRLSRGCYRTSYPSLQWEATACKVAPEIPLAPVHAAKRARALPTMTVGDGADYSAVVTGTISSAVGSFDDVSPSITEAGEFDGGADPTFGAKQYDTTYSLQLNTQFFHTSPACSGAKVRSRCLAWQQFAYSSFTDYAFIQYWLIEYDNTCPANWYTVTTSGTISCYTNSAAATFPGISRITAPDLASTQLTGSASEGGKDEETLSFDGTAVLVSNTDSKLDLASYWNTAEFNVFGDAGGGEANFGADTTLEAQTTLTDGSIAAPSCEEQGFTAETNNLTRTATPAIGTQASPTIVFKQTNETPTTPSCATAGGSKLAITTEPTSTLVNRAFTVGVSIENATDAVLTTRTATVGLAISAGTTGATLTCTGSTTDKKDASAGVATFSCKINTAHAGYKLKATSGNLAAATTSAFAVSSTTTAAKLAITTEPTTTVVNQAFTVGVSIENATGAVVTKTTTVGLAISAGTTGATLTCTGSTTDKKDASAGVATFSCKISSAHISYKLKATSGSLTAATTTAFVVSSTTTAAKLAFTTEPTTTVVNQAFTVGVSIENATGAVLTKTTTVGLAISAGTIGGTSLICTGAATDKKDASAGVATFSCKINRGQTGYKLKATSGSLTAATTTAFNVSSTIRPAKLAVITEPPESVLIDQDFVVSVSIENATGVVLTTRTTTVGLAISAGTTSATLTCTSETNPKHDASSGVASFSCRINKAATGYMLKAMSGELTAASTTAFTVMPTTTPYLTITVEPASIAVNRAFTVGVSIASMTQGVLTTQTGMVALSIYGTTGATLTCTGSTGDSKDAISGVATFSCKINTVGHYRLEATYARDVLRAISGQFAIFPTDAPTKLTFITEPVTSELGASLTIRVSVANTTGVLTTVVTDVTLTIETGTEGATLTCTGGTTQATAAGVASYSCTISKPGASYVLRAQDDTVTMTSSTFQIRPTASKLVFTTEPPSFATMSSRFIAAVSVRNSLTATDTTNTSTVTLTLSGGTTDATLTCAGTTRHAATAGVATFSCSISKTGSTYRLVATDSGLTEASSSAIVVGTGGASGGGGGGASTGSPTPPKAPTGTTTAKSAKSTTSNGKTTLTDAAVGLTVTVTGAGALTVGAYEANPSTTTLSIATGKYLDVELARGSTFTSLALKVCPAVTGGGLDWWNGTGWVPFSDETLASTGCITVNVTQTTEPSLADLTGTPVVLVRTVARIYGQTADATAAAELEQAFPHTGATTTCAGDAGHSVVLARDSGFADALSSQDLAHHLSTGTLLTPTASLSEAALAALRTEGIQNVYVVGGPLAVSTAVVARLEATQAYECGGTTLATKSTGAAIDLSVTRIAGATAYGTSEAVAKFVGVAPSLSFAGAYAGTNPTGGTGRFNDTAGRGSRAPSGALPTAIVATGTTWMDAESASALAYADGIPILLTTPTSLPGTTAAALSALRVKQVIVIGGPLAVSDTVVKVLETTLGISVLRVAGKDYTDTAVELATFELSPAGTGLGWQPAGTSVLVARGDAYTDGLAGAVLERVGSTSETPLLLTESPTALGAYLTAFLKAAGSTGAGIGTSHEKATALVILGGPLAVSTALIMQMKTALQH